MYFLPAIFAKVYDVRVLGRFVNDLVQNFCNRIQRLNRQKQDLSREILEKFIYSKFMGTSIKLAKNINKYIKYIMYRIRNHYIGILSILYRKGYLIFSMHNLLGSLQI